MRIALIVLLLAALTLSAQEKPATKPTPAAKIAPPTKRVAIKDLIAGYDQQQQIAQQQIAQYQQQIALETQKVYMSEGAKQALQAFAVDSVEVKR